MISISLEFAKESFFNAKAFDVPVDNATKKILNEFGSYCRKIARNSIKTMGGNDHAPAGSPPYGHDGKTRYKDFIFYFVDMAAKDVVIGAILLPRKDSVIVPGVLEKGGQAQRMARVNGKMQLVTYMQKARPHMQQAFDKTIEVKLDKLIENSIVA